MPGLFEAIGAGVKAGAIGGYLSGSGSTIACLATAEDTESIAQAMKNALVQTGATGRTVVVPADNVGASVVSQG